MSFIQCSGVFRCFCVQTEKKKKAAALCDGLHLVGNDNYFHTQLIIAKSDANILGGPEDQDLIQLAWFRFGPSGTMHKLPGSNTSEIVCGLWLLHLCHKYRSYLQNKKITTHLGRDFEYGMIFNRELSVLLTPNPHRSCRTLSSLHTRTQRACAVLVYSTIIITAIYEVPDTITRCQGGFLSTIGG